MTSIDQIPDDENGDVLRRMHEDGDDLSAARIVDFCFIFDTRSLALEFAADVPEQDSEVCISAYPERESWQVIVKRHMVPTHRDISAIEADLTERAEKAGGAADGWGCMQVDRKE